MASHYVRRPALRPSWRGCRRVVPPPQAPPSVSKTTYFRTASSSGPLVLVINLERRADRLRALRKLEWSVMWERLPAIDGRALSWSSIDASLVHPQAVREAQYAESQGLPTICRRTGSFSPHLTLAAVGCGLSHRAAWQALAEDGGGREWALILEDDVSGVASLFDAKLEEVLRSLPPTWQICYLGYHESSGKLCGRARPPELIDLPRHAAVTGLFGYLLRRDAAVALLRSVFPLRHQVDFALGGHGWSAGQRFVLNPQAVLITSPKSEEGACDTDVQTLGHPSKEAHVAMPKSMVRI